MSTTYKGIDYGLGRSNRNQQTGIRNGVINQNHVGESWFESSEAFYGKPHCPECGGELPKDFDDYNDCPHCDHGIGVVGEECYPESPLSHFYEKDGYSAEAGESGDIFVFRSPYFTYAQFCSPCAPGACYLSAFLCNPDPETDKDNRAYCFGHDWFDDGKAPYPVYSVETGELINPENT